VILEVSPRRFGCMLRCMMMVTVRQLCMVRGGLVFACFMVSSRFLVVSCGVLVMFCCLMVMVCCLL
jgi:hypothetical protein